MTFDRLAYETEKFKERTKGLNQKDIDWIVMKVVEQNNELKNYKTNEKSETYLLERINLLLYSIKEDKPSNIRAYVEKQLKREEYRNKFSELSGRVFSIKPGDLDACEKLDKEINKFLDKAEKDFPGFKKDYGLAISETMGDIHALRTKGFAGSTRMVREIRRREEGKKKTKH